METELISVTVQEKVTLSNMYQFYHYDFSPNTNQDLNDDGTYGVNIDLRWNPYFIVSSGAIVGFVVVLFKNSDTDLDLTHVIYDFMILKKYRRNWIGRTAAKQAFGLFNANWKVAQMESNTAAVTFWRNVISEYSKNNYTERYREDSKKYIQVFSTKE